MSDPTDEPVASVDPNGAELARLEAEVAMLRVQLRDSAEQLRTREDRESRILAEAERRMRNTLAIVRSVFTRTVTADEDMASHFRGRLDTLTRYQAFSQNLPSLRIDLEQIIRDELQPFQFGYQETITIAGPEVGLRQDLAQILALALHELATNSIKFGVLSCAFAGAELEISWTLDGPRLQISWIEKGVAILSAAPLPYGFGREFLEQALPYQIGAVTSFTLRPGGLNCSIAFPMVPDGE